MIDSIRDALSQSERFKKEKKNNDSGNFSPNQNSLNDSLTNNYQRFEQQNKFNYNIREKDFKYDNRHMNNYRYLNRKHKRSDISNDYLNEKTDSNLNFENSNQQFDDHSNYKKKKLYNHNFYNSGESIKNNSNNQQFEEKNFIQNRKYDSRSYNKFNQNDTHYDKYNRNFNKQGIFKIHLIY